MAWSIEIDPAASRNLGKLDQKVQIEILDYLRERITGNQNPLRFGKPLLSEKRSWWRYRAGDYRTLCEIQDERTGSWWLR